MFYYVAGYYLVMKAVFFFSLVRIQIKFDTMKDHWLFLGRLYTAAVAFLSYVFLMSWQDFLGRTGSVRWRRDWAFLPGRRSWVRRCCFPRFISG